jgi:hypothetical protein
MVAAPQVFLRVGDFPRRTRGRACWPTMASSASGGLHRRRRRAPAAPTPRGTNLSVGFTIFPRPTALLAIDEEGTTPANGLNGRIDRSPVYHQGREWGYLGELRGRVRRRRTPVRPPQRSDCAVVSVASAARFAGPSRLPRLLSGARTARPPGEGSIRRRSSPRTAPGSDARGVGAQAVPTMTSCGIFAREVARRSTGSLDAQGSAAASTATWSPRRASDSSARAKTAEHP